MDDSDPPSDLMTPPPFPTTSSSTDEVAGYLRQIAGGLPIPNIATGHDFLTVIRQKGLSGIRNKYPLLTLNQAARIVAHGHSQDFFGAQKDFAEVGAQLQKGLEIKKKAESDDDDDPADADIEDPVWAPFRIDDEERKNFIAVALRKNGGRLPGAVSSSGLARLKGKRELRRLNATHIYFMFFSIGLRRVGKGSRKRSLVLWMGDLHTTVPQELHDVEGGSTSCSSCGAVVWGIIIMILRGGREDRVDLCDESSPKR